MNKVAWTQEQREWAARLSLAGKSRAEIATAYNLEFPDFPPKTRNSVTGMLDRELHAGGKIAKLLRKKPTLPRAVKAEKKEADLKARPYHPGGQ